MATLPSPVAGRLLRWKSDGTLENVTISDLLDQIASSAQPDPATVKYWIDTSLVTGIGVSPVAGVALVSNVAPAVGALRPVAVAPAGAATTVAGAAPAVAIGSASSVNPIAPAASVAVEATAPGFKASAAVAPAGVYATVAGSAPAISTATTFSVTLSGAAASVTGNAPAVSTGGGTTSVADNFNRSNSTGLGANWTAIQGFTSLDIYQNRARNPASEKRGNYYSGASFASNQYSQAQWGWPLVRVQSNGARYEAYLNAYDDNEGYGWTYLTIARVDANENYTTVAQSVDFGVGYIPDAYWRLEANGSTITLKTCDTATGTYTTRASGTDSTITGGAPGIILWWSGSADDFKAGDL